MIKRILPLFPQHDTYVEVFGGAGNLLIAKEPSNIEVYNDIFSDVVNFFRVLRDEKKRGELIEMLELTPYSREEFYDCKAKMQETTYGTDVERARCFFVLSQQSFGGMYQKSWGYMVRKRSPSDPSSPTSRTKTAIENLKKCTTRLRDVQIENNDFRKIIKAYDTEDTFFYLDPPYVMGTRSTVQYKHEMTTEDHQALINMCLNLKGKAIISGYQHSIYDELTAHGWERKTWGVPCFSERVEKNGTRTRRVECVWLCPRTQADLKRQGNLF